MQLRTEGIHYAEKRCRKLRCGQAVPHSPALQQARLEIELWKAASTLKTGCKYSSRKFRRLEHKTGILHTLQKSKEEIKQEENASFTKYWSAKKDARALRKSFLNKKADALVEEQNIEQSNALKQLITQEATRTGNRQIQRVLKKLNKLSVSTIEVDQEDGTTKEITARHEIEN